MQPEQEPSIYSAQWPEWQAKRAKEEQERKAAAQAALNTSGLSPVEFQVIVEMPPVETKTAGGIIIPDQIIDKDKLSAQEGTLVAKSPHAFTYADGWPEGSIPEPGQRVLIKRYAGFIHEREGRTYRICSDKDIIAIVEPPAAAVREAA